MLFRSFLDKVTHTIYTATLGDSEARIYRKSNLCIPLSCIRNWKSTEDRERAGDALMGKEKKSPKSMRVHGLNVSRGFGDCFTPQVSSEPVLSLNQVQPGDCIVLASDGLWDFVFEEEISHTIFTRKNPAKALALYTAEEALGLDNVTAISITVK